MSTDSKCKEHVHWLRLHKCMTNDSLVYFIPYPFSFYWYTNLYFLNPYQIWMCPNRNKLSYKSFCFEKNMFTKCDQESKQYSVKMNNSVIMKDDSDVTTSTCKHTLYKLTWNKSSSGIFLITSYLFVNYQFFFTSSPEQPGQI